MSTFVYVSSYCSEKPTTSKSRSGARVSSDTQRQPARAQLGLHVDPRRERALARDPRVLVEERVEDLRPEVGHPDVVDVGEREADARLDRRRILGDRLILAAEVARRLLDLVQETRRTGAAWSRRIYSSDARVRRLSSYFVALEHVAELGAVLFGGLREDPARQHLLDAGLERAERRGAVDADVLTRPEMPMVSFTVDLAVGEAAVAQQRALVAVLMPPLLLLMTRVMSLWFGVTFAAGASGLRICSARPDGISEARVHPRAARP